MLEIRMFSFIVILIIHQHNLRNSYVVKYFMFQALRSVALVISLCKGWAFHDILLLISMIKLGAAPFHVWFIRIVEKLNLTHVFWIAVPQKIIPFRLIQLISLPRSNFNKIILMRVVLASLHIITQFKLLKILAASSIYITPWILLCFFFSDLVSWVFFFSYSFTQGLVLILLFSLKVKANPLSAKRGNTLYYRTMFLVIVMAGFPPSPLFFIKLSVLLYLFIANLRVTALMLIFIASVSIFNYLNIVRIGVVARVRHSRVIL